MLEKNAAHPPPVSFSTDLEESQNSSLAMIGGRPPPFAPLATLLSHMELHMQKKLIKENKINLVTAGFTFIGKMTKADEFFVQDSFDKYYSTWNLLFQSQNFPIGAKFISNGETLWCFMIVYIRPNLMKVLRMRKSKFCYYSSCLWAETARKVLKTSPFP